MPSQRRRGIVAWSSASAPKCPSLTAFISEMLDGDPSPLLEGGRITNAVQPFVCWQLAVLAQRRAKQGGKFALVQPQLLEHKFLVLLQLRRFVQRLLHFSQRALTTNLARRNEARKMGPPFVKAKPGRQVISLEEAGEPRLVVLAPVILPTEFMMKLAN